MLFRSSQTLFLGEVAWRSSPGWVSGTRATLRNTGHPINGVTIAAVALAGAGSPSLLETLTSQELDRQIDVKKLREHCRSHLADYKCPRDFHLLPELPRNPAGKILKTALRENARSAPGQALC